ncbi:hypothetical protein DUI87_32162 [Hirundo rustica rustica]|uniref:Uncharacterized protein n=1 Tax=Hirundo rustica rustica TaxID=333673 RepID=A0A3M0IPI4_HIRRU|nr:hypothetical protein DUI87_32162 [Hirundo rustica rustica]
MGIGTGNGNSYQECGQSMGKRNRDSEREILECELDGTGTGRGQAGHGYREYREPGRRRRHRGSGTAGTGPGELTAPGDTGQGGPRWHRPLSPETKRLLSRGPAYGSAVVAPVPEEEEEDLRRRLKYFLMSSCDKYQARGRWPVKLVLQLTKIILVTVQILINWYP